MPIKVMVFRVGVRVQRTEEGGRHTNRLNMIVNIPLLFMNIINIDCIPTHTRQHGKHFPYLTLFKLHSSPGRSVLLFLFSIRCFKFDTMDIGGQIILCHGSCLVHCKIFSCIPGLYQQRASRTLHLPTQDVTTSNVPRYCLVTPGGQNHFPLRTAG